ncbi:MAG: 2-oxo acid dehydrogenase subunit E2, partial [Pseudonocardiaceae bacterium]
MTSIFALPDVGEGLTEAEILSWHVAPGDTVTVNQIIVDIETAKAAVELPSPYAGVVSKLFAEPGATVAVGTPIIAIDTGADPAAAPAGPIGPAPAGAIGEEGASGRIANLVGYGPRTATVARRPRKAAPSAGSAAPSPVPSPAAAPLAKPPVRKLAKELGVDLRTVLGSAAGGVITREDVERAAHVVHDGGAGSAARSSPGSGLGPGAESGAGQRREPVRGVRKATAAAVVSSAFTAPHVTVFRTVDVTPMMELRGRLAAQPRFRDVKLSPLAFTARALCLAVRRTSEVNASWDEATGEIVYFDYVHLGIAAATPRG